VVHPSGASKPPMSTRNLSATRSSALSSRSISSTGVARPVPFGQPRTNFYTRERSVVKAGRHGATPASASNLRRNPSNSSNGSLSSSRSAHSSHIPIAPITPTPGGPSIPVPIGSMASSKSSHNLRTPNDSLAPQAKAGISRRAPSSSSIDRRPITSSSVPSPGSASANEVTSEETVAKNKPKKEVTSRIASLWKKVEDSKKKNKPESKDPRVWITQGKVIPENELALLRQDAQQQQIISNFKAQKQQEASAASSTSDISRDTSDIKPRSRSRLSLKLSKFSKGKRDSTETNSALTPTSPSHAATNEEDNLNGNIINGGENDTSALENVEGSVKRHSRLGSFFNPETSATTSTPADQPNNAAPAGTAPSAARAAVVPPYNYSPPIASTSSSLKSPLSAQVRRNDSYVSSMGRTKAEAEAAAAAQAAAVAQGSSTSHRKLSDKAATSSSAMVTLV